MQIPTPPHDIGAERAVIGSVLLRSDAFFDVSDVVTATDFYHPWHRQVFEAIAECSAANEPIDAVTVEARLKRVVTDPMQPTSLFGFGSDVPSAANARRYAEIVKTKATMRGLLDASARIAQLVGEGGDPAEIAAEAERAIFDVLAAKKGRSDLESIASIAPRTYVEIEQAADRDTDVTGVRTGLYDLDRMTAGLQSSDLIIVGARPSMGKSALAGAFALFAASEDNVGVLVFSLEMSKEQYVKRMFASESRVEGSKLRIGRLEDVDWMRLSKGVDRLSRTPIFIDDTGAVTVAEIRAKCRRHALKHKIGMVIVDYLQLMKDPSAEGREQEVSAISRGLKALAKELNVPVVALAQLNRALEQRADKRPIMSDLRESGGLEQDADVIMFVYRDEVYNPKTETPGVAEIIIAKQRNGQLGTARTKFTGEITRFDNLAPGDDAEGWSAPKW